MKKYFREEELAYFLQFIIPNTVMKSLVILLISSTILFACNNGSDSHEAHTDTSMTADTTHMGGMDTDPNSMMGMMNLNMQQIKSIVSTGHPDHDFAAVMKLHHQGAVQMSEMELAQGQDSTMKEMARKSMEEQNKEIAILDKYLSGHGDHKGGDTLHRRLIEIMNSSPMNMDHSGTIDRQFATMMIPHHQQAIDMSKAYLNSNPQVQELKSLANKIIEDQEKEIKELQGWLAKNQ